jgi:nucleolar protein 4
MFHVEPPPCSYCFSQATEAHLRQAFAPAGFVWELTLPRSSTGRGRGFAFVGFTSKAHAERAIKLVNATKVAGRPVAVDWAVAKAQFGSAQAEAAAAAEGDNPATLTVRQQQGIDAVDSDSEDDLTGPAAKLVRCRRGGWRGRRYKQ